MLLILVLLFFPCAFVGAFVTGDEHDLTAFQGGFFSLQPFEGAPVQGRSEAAAKDLVSSRKQSSRCPSESRRRDRAPAVSMLLGGSSSLPATRSFGGSSAECATTISSPGLVWPDAVDGGGVFGGASQGRDSFTTHTRRRRPRSGSSENSGSALTAMAIPARCALPSVDLLREAYGHRRSFWGDLSPAETRRFYHELLPVSMRLGSIGTSRSPAGDGEEREGGLAAMVDAFGELNYLFGGAQTLEERARLASQSRNASKLYARERCKLPVRVAAHLYDGLRHLKTYGSFRVTGMTWEQLWEKYETKIREEDPTLEGEELKTRICLRILEKSCCTNQVFNNMAGCSDLNKLSPEGCSGSTNADCDAGCDVPMDITDHTTSAECVPSHGSAVVSAYAPEESVAESPRSCQLRRLIKPFQAKKALASSERKRTSRRARARRALDVGRTTFSRRLSRPHSTA